MNEQLWNHFLKKVGFLKKRQSLNENQVELMIKDLQLVLKLEFDNVLCIDCRADYEITFFKNKKKDVFGTTLFKQKCNTKELDCDIRIMDMHDLSFEDNQFDLVFMKGALERALSPYIILSEASRVTKEGKYVAIFLPYIYEWSNDESCILIPTKYQLECLALKCELILIDHIERVQGERKWNNSCYLFRKIKREERR